MYISNIIDNQKTLLPVEMRLKNLYNQYKTLNLNFPNTLDYFSDIFKEAFDNDDTQSFDKFQDKELLEDKFFENGLDVEIYRHLRYLPACWHSHSFFEIVCVFKGSCTNYISQQELEMQEGDICIIAPHTLHTISAFSDDSIIFNIELRTSTFETAFFGTLEGNDVLSDFFTHTLYHAKNHPYIYFKTGNDKELFDYVLYAYTEYTQNLQYKCRMLNNIIMAFFTILLRNHESEVIIPDINMNGNNTNIVQLLKYIQENYNTVTLNELAELFNYSERQIQRIIKNSTGLSYRENIQKLKMKQAARMLGNKDISISEIADELGYSDASSFRAIFKKYYEMTPIEYRSKS